MLALFVHADAALAGTVLFVVGFWSALIPFIPAAIDVVSSLFKGKATKDAAKDSAKILTQGATAAQGQITSAYNNAQQVISPWVQTGQEANTTMGRLMGFNGSGTSMPTAAPTLSTAANGLSFPTNDLYNGAMRPATNQDNAPEVLSDWRAAQRADRQASLGSMMTPTGTNPQTAAQVQTQSSYVQMRSPDGEVQPVPAQLVKHYTNLGAQVVG